MPPTDDWRYDACRSRDPRFDGQFVVCVTSTGIFCRPSCPALTPKRANVRFHRTAAAAQAAGFRACKRCAPDTAPGSPEWDSRGDLVARAVRLIEDGALDRDSVPVLASRLGYSERQLRRAVVAELGVGPLEIARARRARTARALLAETELPASEIAFAAGFSSIRQFNDTLRAVYDRTPTEIRERAPRRSTTEGITLRLAFRPPLHAEHLLAFLGVRAVPGVESWDGCEYARVLRLPHGIGVARVRVGDERSFGCRLHLADLRDLSTAVARLRRLLDLDADPAAVDVRLGESPALRELVHRRPGLRSPGAVDGSELAVRALLGQQVSVAAARTIAGRLTAWHGEPVVTPYPELTHAFPTAEAIAAMDPTTLPMPQSRATALVGLAAALADGDVGLDPGADRAETTARLLRLKGIGPWTVGYIAMRALHDPDADLSSDLVVRQQLVRRGAEPDPAWRPWRSYATHHLWAATADPEQTEGHRDELALDAG